ncbi:MAG: hypothetical protein WBD96_12410 [Pseudolabrys sp.]
MARHRPEFGRRPAYAAPQGGIQAQPPTRLRTILIFLAMPVIGFLLVTLIR